jgi:ZIP family zinc transporter
MLFVSVHELVPMAKRYRHLLFFFWGIVLSVLVYALLAAVTVGQLSHD